VVFVGKSLPPHLEGQTPVEAASLGKPVLLGPGMANFRAISKDLLARGAALQVADARGLEREVVALLADRPRREAMTEAAAAWKRDTGGGVERTLGAIRREFAKINKSG